MFELQRLAHDVYSGSCVAAHPGRVFGGQVVAQALAAAGLTVAGVDVRSLQAAFVGAGDSDRPVRYEVARHGAGGAFDWRQVTALQGERVVLTLMASFHAREPSDDRQTAMPRAPHPEALPDPYRDLSRARTGLGAVLGDQRISLRFVPSDEVGPTVPGLNRQLLWVRAAGRLPDDGLLHACLLTFCSDLTLGRTGVVDREPAWPDRAGASEFFLSSLDHAMWFHRPFRTDEWLLVAQRSTTASGGRTLSFADVWTATGSLICTVAQEVVLRPARRPMWEATAPRPRISAP